MSRLFFLFAFLATPSRAWAPSSLPRNRAATMLWTSSNKETNADNAHDNRRQLLQNIAMVAAGSATMLLLPTPPSNALGQRAVGGAEIECREAGNCLETGQLDGAVGWNWGAKDRCDASDPRCGVNGKIGDLPLGQPVPQPVSKVSYVAEIIIDIGRVESGVLHLGFYDDCPGSVKQMLLFLTTGIATTSKLAFENGMGIKSSPVSLLQGGNIPDIVPGKKKQQQQSNDE